MKIIIGYINLIKKVPYNLKQQISLKNTNSRSSNTINQLSSRPNNKTNLKAIKLILIIITIQIVVDFEFTTLKM